MPRNTSKIVTLVIAVTIAVVLIAPLSSIITGATGQQTVTDETVTADSTYQDLRGYDIEQGSVTVTDTSGNSVNSTYYDVRYDTGEISINGSASTTLTSGEQAEVTYDYQATDSTTTVVAGIVPVLALLFVLVKLTDPLSGMMG